LVAHHPKINKVKLWTSPKICCNLLHWADYIIVEELVQRLWDKVRSYWEHVWEHIENLRNVLKTQWEQQKSNIPPPQVCFVMLPFGTPFQFISWELNFGQTILNKT